MLKNDDGEYGVHYRMKGVSLDTVSKVSNEHYKGNNIEEKLFKLYYKLYKGEKINFDLLSTAVRFKNTKARTVIRCNKFERGVSFKSTIKRNYVEDC